MIESLNDLVYILEKNYNKSNIENLIEYVKNYSGNDWLNYIDFYKNFNRNKVYTSPNFDIFIISWCKDYITPLHSHPENGCILKILQGELLEKIKQNDNLEITNTYETNNVSYMHNDKGTHQINALTSTFSLHVYSPSGFYKT
jgi:hypothetical protein